MPPQRATPRNHPGSGRADGSSLSPADQAHAMPPPQPMGCQKTDTQCASTAKAQLINRTAISDVTLYFQLEQQSSSLDPSPASHLPSATPEWPCLLWCTPIYPAPLCLLGSVPMPHAHHCCPAALPAPAVWCALRATAQPSSAYLPGFGLVGWEGMDEPRAGWPGASSEDEHLSSCPNDTQACCHTAFLAQNAMDGPESWHLAQGLGTVLAKSLEIPFRVLPFFPLLWIGCRCEMKCCFFCNINN